MRDDFEENCPGAPVLALLRRALRVGDRVLHVAHPSAQEPSSAQAELFLSKGAQGTHKNPGRKGHLHMEPQKTPPKEGMLDSLSPGVLVHTPFTYPLGK